MKADIQKKLFYFSLVALFLLQLIFLFLNSKFIGGADNFTHFQISRYAFKYPHLFLDLWGKPVFTTLSAPFAQLGFKGALIFNLLIAIFTLYFTYLTAKKIFRKGAAFAAILSAFSPLYFILILTFLTEILFSFILIVSVYLFTRKKFVLSAFILSFIPFVRTEGYILFPLFALAFILKRQIVPILFLSAGTIFYSIAGLVVFNDFLWLINKFPYPTGESIYGSGNLLHFVEKSNYIFGIPMLLLLVFSTVIWVIKIAKNFSWNNDSLVLFILVAGSFYGYFAAHSFVWWKGMGGSLGLIRVIAGVIPMAGVICIYGIQFVYANSRNKGYPTALLILLILAQIYSVFSYHRLPLKADPVTMLIRKSADYLEENQPDKKVFYFNPEIAFYLGIDPYDQTEGNWGIGDKLKPSNSMDFGDILVWDAHFGPNEGRVSLEAIENDEHLQKIKSFLPLQKITVLGGYDYAIHIFEKVKTRKSENNSDVFSRSLRISPEISDRIKIADSDTVLEVTPGEEYSPNVVIYAEELIPKEIHNAVVEIQFKSNVVISEKDVLLVFSIENGKENLHYKTEPLIWESDEYEWKTVTLNSRFPGNIPDSAVIKIYVWNRNRKDLLIKKLESKITSY